MMRINSFSSDTYFECLCCDTLLIFFSINTFEEKLTRPFLKEYSHRVGVRQVLCCICNYGKAQLLLYNLTQWENAQIKQEWAELRTSACVCLSVSQFVWTLCPIIHLPLCNRCYFTEWAQHFAKHSPNTFSAAK